MALYLAFFISYKYCNHQCNYFFKLEYYIIYFSQPEYYIISIINIIYIYIFFLQMMNIEYYIQYSNYFLNIILINWMI